jgi:hypothetical protein
MAEWETFGGVHYLEGMQGSMKMVTFYKTNRTNGQASEENRSECEVAPQKMGMFHLSICTC